MILSDHSLANKTIAVVIVYVALFAPVFAEAKVGIIVPELRAPFKVIFDSVVDGIEGELNQGSSRLVLNKDYDPNDIARWARQENIRSVVTLGTLGLKASMYVPGNPAIVHGALLSAPGHSSKHPGVALTPDPKALFDLLYQLDNTRKRIVVVYNPAKNQWLVDLAKRQTAANGMQLVAYKATGVKQAAIIYDEIFSDNDLDSTALWLLQDSKVIDSKIVLPFIIEKAWQKEMVVFSSALGHVKNGVLFSMYPDNKRHGEQLAQLINSAGARANIADNNIHPSVGLQNAVNIRTAEHLGINLTRSELREFDVVFPVSN